MDIDSYLRRIGYDGPTEPSLENLRAMQAAHFLSVPFENVDVHIGRECSLDPDVIFDKVVRQRRGGWCYELNGLWIRVLRRLGYQADLLAARMLRPSGELSRPYAHATVLVHLDGESWLSEVDAGSRFAGPLRLHEPQEQHYGSRVYRVASDGDHWFVTTQEPGVTNNVMVLTLQPREFDEFAETCRWQQTAPESMFMQRLGVGLATPRGRIDLLAPVLSEIVDGERSERRLNSPAELDEALASRFGIELSGHSWSATVREALAAPPVG